MPDHDSAPAPGRLAVMLVRRGKAFARVAARRAIVGRNRSRTDPTAGRFTHGEVACFINDAFDRFERQVPGLPGESTIGARQNVMLAALTLSLLEILEEASLNMVRCPVADYLGQPAADDWPRVPRVTRGAPLTS